VKPLVFLDTAAIFALADADDYAHQTVSAIYTDPERRFFLHEWILAESFSLLTKRLHKRAALHMVGALRSSPRVEVVAVNLDVRDAGWERCRRFADKEWDWIDCVSFELMERRGVCEALSLDRHFAQAGFMLLVK
jgi:predicted nucleic acid-binding protein